MAVVTRGAFAKRLCNAFGVEASQRRLNALVAWQAAEGTNAKFNPLATTRKQPGSTYFNHLSEDVGVQNYTSLGSGVAATQATLQEHGHGYESIVQALADNDPAKDILQAVANSAWGTGWLALSVLPFVKSNYEAYSSKPIGQ